MFDLYVNDSDELLVVPQGARPPIIGSFGKWRKKKTRVTSVSQEIRSVVQKQGHYIRKRSDSRKRIPTET
ncbi:MULTISPECIES: hypothetical protein [unclassified Bradyrhizobium]|uniref:hypothetical protein n=1 Tax=unclassified Bradyrhizobium TaxID=2631580 RepID=UPI00247B1525|nr:MULTISPECIES: hypothetical protein [unclassified Bradyrhizobium]WGR73320.1 hypothetical protein MTX24_11105 [Bradyrhizobium sp. ISRA426]WGR78157.1 hypothetical protein MTX21_36075 [Bradyrhizobium sp. ISRA430]WGR88558.1 hypothetical protein MTX25_11115 [Bradyrhizobium sp. ISRA432]